MIVPLPVLRLGGHIHMTHVQQTLNVDLLIAVGVWCYLLDKMEQIEHAWFSM